MQMLLVVVQTQQMGLLYLLPLACRLVFRGLIP